MIIKSDSLEEYFNNKVKNLTCHKNTASYIANTLQKL